MNLLYLKYAVEVAGCGSINKAAKKLYIDQPNLSRSIKDLESSLGVSIFERSTRGMKLTADGEVFLKYAKTILGQVDTVEHMFKKDQNRTKHFSLSAPRAAYISEAFAAFSARFIREDEVEAVFRETEPAQVIRDVTEGNSKLGILRYAQSDDKYYKTMLEEKGLTYELITEFTYVLLMNREHPLAGRQEIRAADLAEFIEVDYTDCGLPFFAVSDGEGEGAPGKTRRILVSERGGALDLLGSNREAFLWTSPVSQATLDRYGLLQRKSEDRSAVCKDVLIYPESYRLTETDGAFVSELCRVKRGIF